MSQFHNMKFYPCSLYSLLTNDCANYTFYNKLFYTQPTKLHYSLSLTPALPKVAIRGIDGLPLLSTSLPSNFAVGETTPFPSFSPRIDSENDASSPGSGKIGTATLFGVTARGVGSLVLTVSGVVGSSPNFPTLSAATTVSPLQIGSPYCVASCAVISSNQPGAVSR